MIGDAAFFVDPLISPGLTGGTAQAYFAAQESARALDAGTTRREFFTAYEGFVHRLHEALERDNQLVYMSFNHPQAIELIQRYQEIDSRRTSCSTPIKTTVCPTPTYGVSSNRPTRNCN